MPQYNCTPCENINLDVEQTLFLGLSVLNFDASVGWNTDPSTLTVTLAEDSCGGTKVCYNECMQKLSVTGVDPGFFGDNRWRRVDGSEYSLCTGAAQENVTDTLVFSGTDLVGSPAYFRIGDFEWCGIIIDWNKDDSCNGNIYRVKLSDPRTILEGVNIITGEYAGCINQTIPVSSGGTGCSEANIFNVYGYMEQFGNCCPPYGYCGDKSYTEIGACPSGLPIDGTIFGTPLNGFGGAFANEDGMPWGQVQLGLNLLANSTPALQNCHSPYGRICFCSSNIALTNSGCGLMSPDIDPNDLGVNACFRNKDYYYLDLSHLSQFVQSNYRIPGPVTSVSELINQLSQDFNFDYYVDLVPFVQGTGFGCVTKVIKVYAVNRNVRPNLNAICDFIESTNCVTESNYGRELRNENTSKFIIGGRKKFIYQIGAVENPDGGTTCEMESINSLSGTKETRTYTPRATRSFEVLDPCSFNATSGNVVTSNFSCTGTIPGGVDITNGAFFSLNASGIVGAVATGNDWDELQACASLSGINLNVSGQTITSTSTTAITDITWEDLGSGIQLVVFACTESKVSTVVRKSNYNCIQVSGYPFIDGTTCCENYDDTIVPYFGTDYNGDILVSCKDGDGNWFFDAPVAEIQSSLSEVSFSGATHVRIGELEMRAALEGYDAWQSFVLHAVTESSVVFRKEDMAVRSIIQALSPLVNGESVLPRDYSNPSVNKFVALNDNTAQRYVDDLQAVYEWILKFARDNYGRQFAVRVPFTCCWWDATNQTTRISEAPSNGGGWTEESNVLGLANNDPNREGQFDFLNFFRDDQGRVTPFVRYDKGILKTISNLSVDDYLVYYEVPENLAGPFTNTGPPTAAPSGTNSAVWIDETTGLVYVWVNNSEWRPVTDACVYQNSLPPTSTTQVPSDCFGVYLDTTNCDIYLNTTVNVTSGTSGKSDYFTGGNWINVNFYLYVKAQIQEDYVFHDKSDCWSPRVVVSVPQAVHLREEDPRYLSGIVENMAALVTSRPACATGIQTDLVSEVDRSFGNGTSDDAWFRIHEKACIPGCAAIPMESRSLSYGPWYNPSDGCGRTDVVQDESLVPWNFGSYSTMNQAGQFVADNARADMKAGELGRVCLPGYPTLPLGAELGAVNGGYYGGGSYLVENRSLDNINFSGTNAAGSLVSLTYQNWQQPAVWTGLYGPNITNISIRGGCDFQTCYSMRTFSPPRNNALAKYTLEQLQKFKNSINYQTRRVKELIDQNKQLAFARSFFSEADRRVPPRGQIQEPGGNTSIIQGNIIPWKTKGGNAGFSRPFAGDVTSAHMSEQIQNNYGSTSYMSQDGFFRPISLYGDGGLPRFTQPSGVNVDSTGIIAAGDLNPFQNPVGLDPTGTLNKVARLRSDSSGIGHDIDIVGRSQSNGAVGQGSLSIDGYDRAENGDYATDYRPMALRGPLVVTGWGYDCDGNPVPNKNDTEANAASGILISSGQDPNKFLDGHLRKSHTWATGPVDLRWDHSRGVWKAGGDGNVNLKCYTASQDIAVDASGNVLARCNTDAIFNTSCSGAINLSGDLTPVNKSCCAVQFGDKVLVTTPSGSTTPEIVCSIPKQPQEFAQVAIYSQVPGCCEHYGSIRRATQLTDAENPCNVSGVLQCNIRTSCEEVFIIPQCDVIEGECVGAVLLDKCYECNGEQLPLYIEQSCDICCPVRFLVDGTPVANLVTLRLQDPSGCLVKDIDMCFYQCVSKNPVDSSGNLETGLDVATELTLAGTSGADGGWVGFFECTAQVPKRVIRFEADDLVLVGGADDFIFFEIDGGCTLTPTQSANAYVYSDNNSVALTPYAGPFSNLRNPTCHYLFTDNVTAVFETCTYKYWVYAACDTLTVCPGFGNIVSWNLEMGHMTFLTEPTPGSSTPNLSTTGCNSGAGYLNLPYWREENPSTMAQMDCPVRCSSKANGTWTFDRFGQVAEAVVNISGFGDITIDPFAIHRICGCGCDFTAGDVGVDFPPLCTEDVELCPTNVGYPVPICVEW